MTVVVVLGPLSRSLVHCFLCLMLMISIIVSNSLRKGAEKVLIEDEIFKLWRDLLLEPPKENQIRVFSHRKVPIKTEIIRSGQLLVAVQPAADDIRSGASSADRPQLSGGVLIFSDPTWNCRTISRQMSPYRADALCMSALRLSGDHLERINANMKNCIAHSFVPRPRTRAMFSQASWIFSRTSSES